MATQTVSKLETPFKSSTRIIKSVRVVTTGSVDIHPEHIRLPQTCNVVDFRIEAVGKCTYICIYYRAPRWLGIIRHRDEHGSDYKSPLFSQQSHRIVYGPYFQIPHERR